MKRCWKYLISVQIACSTVSIAPAQQSPGDTLLLKLGKPLPVQKLEVFNFRDSEVLFQDRRKKGLVLDFWSQGCLACVESLPNVNAIYDEYKGRIDLILVGLEGGSIKQIFAKYKKKLNLNMPYAFDSTIFKKLGIRFVPRMILIDTEGNVRAVGSSSDLNRSNIEAFIHGRPLQLQKLFGGNESNFDYNKPLLVNGNGGPDSAFLFRSILTDYNPEALQISPSCIKKAYCTNQIMIGNSNLYNLYDLAYGDTIIRFPDPFIKSAYGKYWIHPLLSLKDTSLFAFDIDSGKNLFCYNATVPFKKATTVMLQMIMRHDLNNYFGYKVTIENRLMPCWRLISNKWARENLLTKGGKPHISSTRESAVGLSITNFPISALIARIWPYHQSEPPILDGTGITGNVDLTLDCIMANWGDLLNALNKQGLNLIPGKAIMKVIVIGDRLKNGSSNDVETNDKVTDSDDN